MIMAELSILHQSILSLTCVLLLHTAISHFSKLRTLALSDMAEYVEHFKLQTLWLRNQGHQSESHVDRAVQQDLRIRLGYISSQAVPFVACFCLAYLVKALRSELPQDVWRLIPPVLTLLAFVIVKHIPEQICSWFFVGTAMRDLLVLYLAPDFSCAIIFANDVQGGYLGLQIFSLCHNWLALMCWQIVLSLLMWHRCCELIAFEPHPHEEDWVFNFMVGRLRATGIVFVGAHVGFSFVKAKTMASIQSHEAAQAKATIETLLASVCDVVLHLRSDFSIANPAPKLASLVRSAGLLQGRLLTDFMPEDDSRHYRNHAVTFEEFGHALSLNSRLQENGGGLVPVKVFHIPFEDVCTGQLKYLVGLTELEHTETLPDLAVPPISMLGLQDSFPSEHMSWQRFQEDAKDEDVLSVSLSSTTTDRKALEKLFKRTCEVATQVDFAALPDSSDIAHKAIQTNLIAADATDSERILTRASSFVEHRLEKKPPRLPGWPLRKDALPRKGCNIPKEHKRMFTMFEVTPLQTVKGLLHEVVCSINVVARPACCTYHSGVYCLQQQCKKLLSTATCRELDHDRLIQCSGCLRLQVEEDEEFICDFCFGQETRPLNDTLQQELSSGVEADNSSNDRSERVTRAVHIGQKRNDQYNPAPTSSIPDNVAACGPSMLAHTTHTIASTRTRSNIVDEQNSLMDTLALCLVARDSSVEATGTNRSSKGTRSIGDEIDIFAKFLSQPPQELFSESDDPDALRSRLSKLSKKFNTTVTDLIHQTKTQVHMSNAEFPPKDKLSKCGTALGAEVDALIDFLLEPPEERIKKSRNSKAVRSFFGEVYGKFNEVAKGIMTQTGAQIANVLEMHTTLIQGV